MTAISAMTHASPVLSSPGVSGASGFKGGGAHINAPASSEQLQHTQNTQDQPSLQAVQQAVKQANAAVQSSNRSISFGYEERLGELIVQVSDKTTGQLIHQFPSKDFIQFQIHMREMVGLLLDKKA